MTTYYTITGKNDGFGAQYQAILSGVAYCNYNNYIYIHTPFIQMDHNVDINKANKFIGINTTLCDNSCNIIIKTYEPIVHDSTTPSIYYTNKVLEYIRSCYFSSKKPSIDMVDIAIHIRRGDVSNVENKKRYIDNSVYIKIINTLKERYKDYTITIFSEGVYEDFIDLGLEENCFKLNMDVFKTFHSLVTSKVLIQSFSSFSYCAGLINRNTIYHYDTFWHKRLDHWLKVSDLIDTL